MSIQTEIDRINTSVAAAYAVMDGLGATMPNEQTVDNLAATAATIPTGSTAREFRPNLLDNWYFGNPVNQRGATSGNGATSAGYFIDRWARLGYADGAVSVANSELEIDSTQAPGSCRLVQTLEFATPVGTYTASVLATGLSGKGYIDIYAEDGTFAATVDIEQTGITSLVVSGAKIKKFYIGAYAGSVIRVSAAKLELGDTQTLAHQDEDGNWQLNEIPDYGEQLAKCQRYFVRLGLSGTAHVGYAHATSATAAAGVISLPCPMRAEPTVTKSGSPVLLYSSAPCSISAVSINHMTANVCYFNITSSGLTAGRIYAIRLPTAYLEFSADL